MMARSHHATCSKCGFEFCGGHSHHESSEWFVCLDCLQIFELVTENPFGPRPNELVPITRLNFRKRKFRRTIRHRVDTGKKATAMPGKEQTNGKYTWQEIAYEMTAFMCDCGSNRFAFEFNDGDICPKCKCGKLVVDDVIY